MSRPQFTSPVEREQDKAARSNSFNVATSAIASVSAGATANFEPISNAGQDDVLQSIFAGVEPGTGTSTSDLNVEVRMKNSADNLINKFTAHIDHFPINLDPGLFLEKDGSVEIDVANNSSSSLDLRVSVITRPA